MLKGDLSSFSLGEIFQSLAINNHTGTLKISSPSHGDKLIFFSQGEISLFSHGSAGGLRIGEVLVRMGRLSRDDLEVALAEQKKSTALLGQVLLKRETVTEDDIGDALKIKIREEIYDLFLWTSGVFEFHMGACPDELFDEMQRSWSVSINTNSVIMEGLRRLDEWNLISKKIRSFDEIYVQAGPAPDDLDVVEQQVFKQLGDIHRVRDHFETFNGTRFGFCKAACDLLLKGVIRELTPDECTAAAQEHFTKRRFPQAINFLTFAAQLQPDDATLHERIASAFAAAGQETEARRAWVQALRIYGRSGETEKTAAVAQELIPGSALDAEDLEICFQALLEVNNAKKAASAGTQLAAVLQEKGEVQHAVEVLQILAKVESKDLNLKLQIATLLEKAGEGDEAKQYLDDVAHALEEQEKYRELLKILRLSLTLDPEQQHIKEKVAAVQALLERRELRKKRRFTILVVSSVALIALSLIPILYEFKAREYFRYAQRVEKIAFAAEESDFQAARDAYNTFIEKYGVSTKIAEAQTALHRLNLEEAKLRAEELVVKSNPAEQQARIEAVTVAFVGTFEEAQSAEESGDIQKAHALYLRLIRDFPELPASKRIRLPLSITSEPRGATAILNGEEVGKTPFVHYYDPGESIEIKLTQRSCTDLQDAVELQEQWQLHFELKRRPVAEFRQVPIIQQPMVVSKDRIVTPCRDGRIYSVQPKTQEVIWERMVGRFGDRLSDLHVAGDSLYFVTVGGVVQAMSVTAAEPIWAYRVDNNVLAAPVVSPDGKYVAVGTASGTVFLLDNSTGKAITKVATENEIIASPLFAGDLLVAGSTDNHVYAYSLSAQKLKFVMELTDDVVDIALLDAKTLLAVTRDARIHCLSLASSSAAWSSRLDEAPSSNLTISQWGIHVGTSSGQVVTLSRETGEVLWNISVGQGAVKGIGIATRRIYVGLETGYVAAVDLKAQDVAWSYRTGSPVLAPPLIDDRILYIGDQSGKLWVFEVLE
jgi:outer membrane protein assembly factor BamB/tetratricopeptide (TPR) repeat protein